MRIASHPSRFSLGNEKMIHAQEIRVVNNSRKSDFMKRRKASASVDKDAFNMLNAIQWREEEEKKEILQHCLQLCQSLNENRKRTAMVTEKLGQKKPIKKN